jgi:ribonuclease J
LPKHEVLIVATGSQGEPRAALGRLAGDNHPDCEVEAGDTVIFSSITIPGNEKPIEKMVENLKSKGLNVIQSNESVHTIHASGHPNQEDLSDMYEWVSPKVAIPVHGEPEHLHANALIAKQQGVETQLVGLNGDLYQLAPSIKLIKNAVKVGRIDITELNKSIRT